MIILHGIALRRGAKLLIDQGQATLQHQQKIALIGANGCGKSSLFAMLLGTLPPDAGDIRGLESMRIAHMAQELESTTASAKDYVTAGHHTAHKLLTEVADAEAKGEFDRAAELHLELDHIDGYAAPRTAEQLLLGLGFEPADHDKPVTAFSGGWRIRLNLARALMTPSDLLLLDEPTNHLDLDATLWLQDWLKRYPGTLVMISHDRDFIDATCDRVMKIEGGKLLSFKGNYSSYEVQRAEQLAQQQVAFDKQQTRIAEIENFVRRFRAKATKAKQAQSRLKELERMTKLAPAHVDSPFSFQFPEPGKTSDPLLKLDQADLGYPQATILRNVNLTLRPGDRIALLGKNGAGKSTLLKSLAGKLALQNGDYFSGAHLRIGYFDQQQIDVLDFDASPLLHIQRLSPDAREQEILNFLGGFNFKGDMATESIRPFSGGEKARLALAMVVWEDPNLLVLDEPTNHLDLEMRHALEIALQGYEGALLLVSHDRHLIRNSVETLFLVHDGEVSPYDDDLAAYEQWIVSKLSSDKNSGAAKEPANSDTAREAGSSGETRPEASKPGVSKKEARQAAAELREKLRPLKKAADANEKKIHQIEAQLTEIETALSESCIYEDSRKDELAKLIRDQGALKASLGALEEEWFEQLEALEAMEAELSV